MFLKSLVFFDDCMKIVEKLSETYHVALLNSKNAWRILGQESYAYEIAQDFDYDLRNVVVVVPIGNAGNITAVMRGFLKFLDAGIIDPAPQNHRGSVGNMRNPVYRYYREPEPSKRHFEPVSVRPSVAQAAMIGNPVSMPRVIQLVEHYQRCMQGNRRCFFVEVTEQEIMDWELLANRNGHIACTHGGECLAGLVQAIKLGHVAADEIGRLRFHGSRIEIRRIPRPVFWRSFPRRIPCKPKAVLKNAPALISPKGLDRVPEAGKPLKEEDLKRFVDGVAQDIASALGLKKR